VGAFGEAAPDGAAGAAPTPAGEAAAEAALEAVCIITTPRATDRVVPATAIAVVLVLTRR
jgi:hypothetical protein